MNSLFNTIFETELRLLIILEAEDSFGSCEVTDGKRVFCVSKQEVENGIYYRKIPTRRQLPPDQKVLRHDGKMMMPEPSKNHYRLVECKVLYKTTAEKLAALDFVVLYGASFGITESNLHGEGDYKFSEFATRRELTQKALRELVRRGFIKVENAKAGFIYLITAEGKAFCEELTDEYSEEYREALMSVMGKTENMSEREFSALINSHSVNSLKRS